MGAARSDVLRMLVGQGATLAVTGIAAGLAGALALTGLLRTLVFGIEVIDPLTFVAAPLGILLIVLVAALIPSLRGMGVSPATALRYE